ncbi:MAG TPA: CHAT domain-containing protein [Vicinamibacteria bacterium]|nr:CHAT domain-containing protein [Vicinamibacteria bacterium]
METDRPRHPGLAALDDALSAGDVEAAREALLLLDAEERAVLEAEMGPGALASTYRLARSRRRGPGLGRVIVLPGLMGSELDSVGAGGGANLVWVSYFRLFFGRIADMRLTDAGDSPPPPPTIRPKQLYKKVYLPLLLALQARWQTRPFPYDWRVDVDRSAAALADEVRSWAGGEPCHLVAHSMGGIVARRFVQKFPDVWASMQDPSGEGRGGRLVMMGTPNRGSYAIPLALSGEEKTVRSLAKLDFKHDRASLLRILNTFVGSYQLLPSPKLELGGDDHRRLFDAATWGNLPVRQELLDRGKAFMTELEPVVDAGRLVFVGGYNQETPHRIHVDGPGRFRYESTLAGDGRVPHETGLLEGVATFWVMEEHGDLPRNAKVLAGIHDLLQKGTTAALETRRAAVRSARPSAPYDPATKEAPDPEVDTLAARLKPSRARERKPLTLAEEMSVARLEGLAVAAWLGKPSSAAAPRGIAAARPVGPKAVANLATHVPRLHVEVVWGDITRTAADVLVAGLYRGVHPQNALLALDKLVSGRDEPPLVLTEQARRGLLRGDLGDVELFPVAKDRLVAVGGMGHSGTFGEAQLRLLARNLTSAVANLPRPRTIGTVLVGAGEGNLGVPAAVRSLFLGIGDALVDARVRTRLSLLRIVELNREKAAEILRTVQQLDLAGALALDVKGTVVRGPGLAPARRPPAGARLGTRVRARATPARLTFVRTADAIRASVITRTSTIPERSLRLDATLVDELVVRMKDPDVADVARLSALLRRLLLPREFVSILPFASMATLDGTDESPFVFEVDRDLARVHWEMMASDLGTTAAAPLAVQKQVARQLRTEYSPPPAPEANPGKARRALVIGDPGDPAKGHNLPGARREALRVAEILQAKGLEEVACYVGARNDPEQPSLGVPPATRIDVLDRLLEGGWDILHYAGHGDFMPGEPDRAGWVFQDGLLTSRELERMDTAPRLVVANACLSSLTSSVGAGGSVVAKSDAQLVATLADEFFRRGVRDYIGTAWEVNDEGAIQFAEALYEALLTATNVDCSLGAAILKARRALAAKQDVFGALWAAYQHYGDPTASLIDVAVEAPSPRARASGGARRSSRRRGRRRARRAR